jgi:subtilisin-like proprotein convertase family protein
VNAPPQPFLELGTVTSTAVDGDGDAFIEPGESANVLAQLINIGGATAIDVVGELSTMTPGVTIGTSMSPYPNIGSNGGAAVNSTPFTFSLAPDAACGIAPDFTLTASYSNGTNSPQTFNFSVQTGQPGATPASTSYTGPPVPIPDNVPAGVDVPLVVTGATGAIADVSFSIDGSSCTAAAGATSVGLDHSFVGDLVIRLTSPAGTSVTLANRPGGQPNSGNNFCQTVFDDDAATSIQAITPAGAPYTGSFQPATPLAALIGEDPNGTWTLNVADTALLDMGSVRAFSLTLTPFVCSAPPTMTTSAGQ